MLRKAIFVRLSLLLIIGGLAATTAQTSSTETDSDSTRSPHEQLIEAITEDYLKLLDFEMIGSRNFFQHVLEDEKFQDVRSEILLSKILILQNYIDHIAERRQKKLPPMTHKPARFFHLFGKSLLYKEFIDIVARLNPYKSNYDQLIEDVILAHGMENFMESVDEKRSEHIAATVQRMEEYVNGLSPVQRRKAEAQKLSDWALKMKQTEELSQKMEIFTDFLRHEYLETMAAL